MALKFAIFIPTGSDRAQPAITFDEAAHELQRAAGAAQSGFHPRCVGESDGQGEGEGGIPAIRFEALPFRDFTHEDRATASNILIHALFDRALKSYVVDRHSGQYYRIPREYWLGVRFDVFSESHGHVVQRYEADDEAWPDGVMGEMVLLLEADFKGWLASGVGEMKPKLWNAGSRFADQRDVLKSEPPVTRRRTPTPQQNRLFDFFKVADAAGLLPGGEKYQNTTATRQRYETWNEQQKPKLKALTRDPFEKHLRRWQDDEMRN